MLIMATLEHLNELLVKSGFKCPKCGSEKVSYKPTKLVGINYYLTIDCENCTIIAGNWALPPSANFAFAIHTLANGLKFSQLQKLFQSMNFPLNFENRIFRTLIEEASLALIDLKDQSVTFWFEKAKAIEDLILSFDATYCQNNFNSQFSFTSGMARILGKARIICCDILKRPQEIVDVSKIKGRFIKCLANHLEGHSIRYLFEIIKPLCPSVIVADGDVKLAKIVAETSWLKPVILCQDLAHLLKNAKPKMLEVFKSSNLTGASRGLSNNNRMMITEHFHKNLLFFSKKIAPKDRNLLKWKKITQKMLRHLNGETIKNYQCPVFNCSCRDFFVNNKSVKKPIAEFRKNFNATFVNDDFIKPFLNAQSTSNIESFHSSLWSQHVDKNTSHNIRTRVTEARVSAAIINYNESKSGYNVMLNSLHQMETFKINDKTASLLNKKAEKNTERSKKYKFKKKAVHLKRVSSQIRNSDVPVDVPAYKCKKND